MCDNEKKTKSGYVAIIGKPNVGKSTLMNALLGEKLSIVTSKPQTTRKRVLGILNEENSQIIFLDTPGILKPAYLLQEKLLEFVNHSVINADVIVVIIDAEDDPRGKKTLEDNLVKKILGFKKLKKILLINKIDLSNNAVVKTLFRKVEELKIFDKIIPISALVNMNVESVKETIIELLPEGPKYYPDDQLSDENERFFVSEIIREKIFELYQEEIPYSTEVIIEEFKEREGRKDYILASIIIEKESQKPIIIGKGGNAIKKIGRNSRSEIETFLGRSVYLELRVKVKSKWRSNLQMLKSFGYTSGKE